ncbi:MAG: restriction endonuclease subunit S, partial [Chryseobacterium sp.]|nr:restriction endonuclease subunit S [Chryseobacterium sp.]
MGVVKISEIREKGRFDASPFVSESASLVRFTKNLASFKIGELSFIHKVRNRNSRVYVEDKEKGLMYLSNTDMQRASFDNVSYMSKKFLPYIEEQKLKNGDIIVSAVGTIGQVALINDLLKDAVISGNILRFTPEKYPGYIFAYMQCKYGQANLINVASGSVQDFITPPKLADFDIPIVSEQKQEQINDAIINASNLRVESNIYLREAVSFFDKLQINYRYGASISQSISIKEISGGYKRFDSLYAVVGKKVKESLFSRGLEFKTLRSQTSGIFMGPRAKRNYVGAGIPFLSTSAMQKANPTKTDKFISLKSSSGFTVEEGWLLTTRSGTLGDTIYTLPCMSGYAVSEDAIRIVINNDAELSKEYVYAFLKSEIGRSSLLS